MDVMKSPVPYVLGALRLCNPPAFLLLSRSMWPAISKRSLPGFLYYLMRIPIEPTRPHSFLSAKVIKSWELDTGNVQFLHVLVVF